MSKLKYSLSSDTWDKEEKESVINLIQNNNILTFSKNVTKFENRLAKYFNSKFSILVNSGSSANLLAIYTLFFLKNKLKKGDEVIIPAIGWSTSYAPLAQLGLKIVLCDVEKDTFNICYQSLQKCYTKKTKLIVAINLIGNISNLKKISNFCKQKKIYLFEDNCEGMGSKNENKYCGTYGIASSFSTYFSHHISTIEGGFILTDDPIFYNIAKSIRSHGWTRNIDLSKLNLSRRELTLLNKNKDNKFQFLFPGFNLRPTEITAVLGLCQIKKLKGFLKARYKNQKYIENLYHKHSEILDFYRFHENAAYFFIPLYFRRVNDKIKFENFLISIKNIEFRALISGNINDHIFIKHFDKINRVRLPNTEYLTNRVILLGNSHNSLEKQIDLIGKYLRKVFYA